MGVGQMAKLVEFASKRSHAIDARTVIGRDATSTICIDDPMISGSHAEIIQDATGAYKIRDLGSRRGTFVGSRKVTEAALAHGDEILIGPVKLRFEQEPKRSVYSAEYQELVRLRAVAELGHAIGVEHDLQRVIDRVLETCLQLLRADRAAIIVYQPHSKVPHMTATRARAANEPPFAISTSVLSQVMIGHEPYLRTEVDDDAALRRSESLSAHGVRSVMAVPLRYQADETEWLGVIQIDSRASFNVFSAADLELLTAISGPTSLAIKNSLLVQQVQAVIRDEGARVERVVRSLPVGVVVIDNERRCVLANRWITDHAEAVGALHVGAEVTAIAGITTDVLTRDTRAHELTTEGQRVLSIAATTSADANETVIIVSDITAERERQNQTAHRDRVALLGQLAGGSAHDFNNLLVVILNYAHMLEESLEDPAAREDVHEITHAATSAADLTRQLLSFTRRELVKTRVVDLVSVVRGMNKMLVRTLGEVQLVTEVSCSSAHVLIDSSQLEQILMNLVVNARDAMPNGGGVAIAVSMVDIDAHRAARRAIQPGRYVSVEVRDAGTGMSPEVMARIFEPYFTTKARGQGTGLGLATVYGLIQQAHGDIVVESTIDVGTTFRIYLPETERVEATTHGEVIGSRDATILVVDDDESVRRITERMLKREGYNVLSASSGEAALEVARAHPGEIHTLLTDMVMPGMSGRELARELAVIRPDTRVIFMSGYHQDLPISSAQFVAKPFDRTGLLEKIQDNLIGERSR
ncbi:hypothetical protein BH11MYX1_BH11MYX1_50150 [soil metagenome]